MAFALTGEQVALGETVRAVLHRSPDAGQAWRALCEQVGVPGLAIPEEYGGLGAGLAELQVVAAELGRELTACPFLGSAVLATHAVLFSGDDQACARLLPGLASGEVAALAWADERGWPVSRPAFVADGSILDGSGHYVLDGDAASVLLAVATVDGGTGLFEVDPAQPGVRCAPVPTMDTTRGMATVRLDGAAGRRIGGEASAALAAARDVACAVLAAEQAGAAERALEITVDYTKQREQFGRPIGGFQALKHRMADLYVLVQTAFSAARAAASGEDRTRAAAVAKAYCSEAFRTVAGEMIQLHGGIGVTWEHPAHRYLKRAHGSAQLFGQPHEYLRTLVGGRDE